MARIAPVQVHGEAGCDIVVKFIRYETEKPIRSLVAPNMDSAAFRTGDRWLQLRAGGSHARRRSRTTRSSRLTLFAVPRGALRSSGFQSRFGTSTHVSLHSSAAL